MSERTVILAPQGLDEGIAALAGEKVFAAILERAGAPRFRRRANGFPTLLHIILEQQVSLASARGANCHVDACMGGFTLPFLERAGLVDPGRVPPMISLVISGYRLWTVKMRSAPSSRVRCGGLSIVRSMHQ